MPENRAIVAVHAKVPNPGKNSPVRYIGITELVGTGFTQVEVVLPHGVREFPACPYMVTVPCEDTYVEFRKGKLPLLEINGWEPIQHYYY